MIFRRNNRDNDCASSSAAAGQNRLDSYIRLEERRVLNATFAFDLVAAELTLENFVDSGTGDNSVILTQSADDFVFELQDGFWQAGSSVAGLDFTLTGGDSILTINNGALSLSSLVLNDNTSDTFDIQFDQFNFATGLVQINDNEGAFGSITEASGSASSIQIDQFEFAAGTIDLTNGSHDFNTVSGVATAGLALADVDDLNVTFLRAQSTNISIMSGGDLTVSQFGFGIVAGDNVELIATGADSDVNLENTIVAAGQVSISAADQFTLNSANSIFAGGNIELLANVEAGTDGGRIVLEDGSLIASANGTIHLANETGSGTGDVLVSQIASGNATDEAISITTSGSVIDNSASEIDNLFAFDGAATIKAEGNIGGPGNGDLNIDATGFAFDTFGSVYATNLDGNLTIESLSTLPDSFAQGGGTLTAGGSLIVNSDIEFGSDVEFATIPSGQLTNEIRFRDGVVQLDSSTAAQLVVSSADRIVFQDGQIVTTGSDNHQISLLADQDNDGTGSITNLPGMAEVVITNHLVLNSSGGIGDSGPIDDISAEPLRINVDTLTAENRVDNGVFIVETDDIAIHQIINIDRTIDLTAGGNIIDADIAPDDLDLAGKEITLRSLNGSVGTTGNDIFKSEFNPLEIVAPDNLLVVAENGLIAVDGLESLTSVALVGDSVVFYSDGNLDAIFAMSISTIAANNLALIADGDNDGAGTLTIGTQIAANNDLRIDGHEIVALNSLSEPALANLSAHRLLISTDASVQLTTNVAKLDIELDSVDAFAASFLQIDNNGALQMVDLNCDGHSILATNDDVRINNLGSVEIVAAIDIENGTLLISATDDLTQQSAGTITAYALGIQSDTQTVLDADNNVQRFASRHEGFLLYNDVDELIVDTVIFASGSELQYSLSGIMAAGADTKLITGGDLQLAQSIEAPGGAVFLDIDGRISQTQQATILADSLGIMSARYIELTAPNEIEYLAIDSARRVTFSNAGDLTITSVAIASETEYAMEISGIDSELAVKLNIDGDLKIDEAIVGTKVFLTVGQNVTQTSVGTITGNRLGLMVGGSTELTADNDVNRIAAFNQGLTIFNDIDDLIVGTVEIFADTPLAMSAVGITSLADVKISTGDNLQLHRQIVTPGSVFLDSQGNIGQFPFGTITADSLAAKSGEDLMLGASNQVSVFAGQATGSIVFHSERDLSIGDVTAAAETTHAMSLGGIETDFQAKISSTGNLSVDSAIVATNVFLNVTYNVSQTSTGTIIANQLGIMTGGNVILDADNDVDTIAIDSDGLTIFNDRDNLAVGTATIFAETRFAMTISGIQTGGSDAKILAGDLFLNELVDVGTANIAVSVDGDLTQDTTGTITANGLLMMVTGHSELTAANNIEVVAAQNVGTIVLNATGDLQLGQVAVATESELAMEFSGIESADLKISLPGNLFVDAAIQAIDSNVFLAIGGDILQSGDGTIHANKLGVMAGGDSILNQVNRVDVYASTTTTHTIFNNAEDLIIGSVVFGADTVFEMSVTGVTNENADTKISAVDLFVENAIDVGNLFIVAEGNVAQSTGGTITANSLGLMINGRTVLDAQNQIQILAAGTGQSVLFNNDGDLVIGTATVFSESEFAMQANGIITENSDLKLNISGSLFVDQAINVESATAFFTVDSDLGQTQSITAGSLGLMIGGTTILDAENNVSLLAASNVGMTIFNNADDFAVGTATVFADSELAMTAAGIDNQSDVKLSSGGSLNLLSTLVASGSTVFISADSDFTQTSTGTITADQLGLMINGQTTLRAANDVDHLAANNRGAMFFTDIDDLTISTVMFGIETEFRMQASGIVTEDSDAKIDAGGNIFIDDRIDLLAGNLLLAAGGNIEQSIDDADGLDGFIVARGLGLMAGGNTNLWNAANAFDTLAAQNIGHTTLQIGNDLSIGEINVDAMNIVGAKFDADFELSVAGSLAQTSALVVQGDTLIVATGNVCLAGGDCDGDGINDNDWVGSVTVTAGDHVEISDANDLTVQNIVADRQIYLRAGGGQTGTLSLLGELTTIENGGQILLQADSGITQTPANSIISTTDLLLGSTDITDARTGNVILLGDNSVTNIAAYLDNDLQFTNRHSLQITPLTYSSICNELVQAFDGINVNSVTFNVSAPGDASNLTDSLDAISIIRDSADFNVAGDIELGDGQAFLAFTGQSIADLLNDNVADSRVQISAASNGANPDGSDIATTQNVSLFVDSSIILADTNVADLLLIDSSSAETAGISAGDILQTQYSDADLSLIEAPRSALVSAASIQLTNTSIDQLAIEADDNHSLLIRPFAINLNIGSTFTGSIDANVFADPTASQFLLGGNLPANGIFDVNQAFTDDGFFSGNNDFVNALQVGSIIVNQDTLDLVAFDALGLSANQLANVNHVGSALTTLGDSYIETTGDSDLNITANADVISLFSNLTVIAGNDIELFNGAELRRLDDANLIGLVNTIQGSFRADHFELNNPRSVIAVPGDFAFSDLNSQLDSAIGFQNFDLFLGNPGEQSFNLIAGWFVAGVMPAQAIDAAFQQTLLQQMDQTTAEFLLSDFSQFGQGVSALSIQLPSQIQAAADALLLTNVDRFEQSFFADQSFLLSQIFVTNDARINLFADGGRTDLNFSQEVLPTRTVVENPDPIVVATPTFNVPESPGAAPVQIQSFVNLIQDPESQPISTEQPAQSYFLVKYTADDDGIFEESFAWEDPNDDPDAIRAALENAMLDDSDWPDTADKDEGNWTKRIKEENEVKPGLYFIFEFQEEELPNPVDAPVNRTDIENLVEPSEENESTAHHSNLRESSPLSQDSQTDHPAPIPTRFSESTQQAYLASSLLFAQCLINRTQAHQKSAPATGPQVTENSSLFSRARRLLRNHYRNQ